MSPPLNCNSRAPLETHNSINWQLESARTHTDHTSHIHKKTADHWRQGLLPRSQLDPVAFVQYYCQPHEWFSGERFMCVHILEWGVGEFTCSVFKVRVQHLLSGAALEMFLSCCRSFLLSWRISSRSLASPSSPPATWDGCRRTEGGERGKGVQRHKNKTEMSWSGGYWKITEN